MKHPEFKHPRFACYGVSADCAGIDVSLVSFVVARSVASDPLLVIMPDKASSARLLSDLLGLLSGGEVRYVGHDLIDGVDQGQANSALRSLLSSPSGIYISQPSELLKQVDPGQLKPLRLSQGSTYSFSGLEPVLAGLGFQRVDFVVEPGTFSIRGGVVDLFPGDRDFPVRLDFMGNLIEGIVAFDPVSQRSGEALSSLQVFPESLFVESRGEVLLSLLPPQLQVFHYRPSPEDALSLDCADHLSIGASRRSVSLFQKQHEGLKLFSVDAQPDFQRNLDAFRGRLQYLNENGFAVYLCADSSVQLDRLGVLFKGASFVGVRLSLSAGFIDHANKIAVLTDHQVFGRTRRRNFVSRQFPLKPGSHVGAFSEGDIVVHLDFGVARYLGVERISVGSRQSEVMTLEYELGDRIYVPVDNMNRVHRYESHTDTPIKLTRLRTTEWEQAKLRTKKAVDTYTRELMSLYAQRFVASGYSFLPDDDLQKEMEAAFIYDETSDQLKAIEEVKRDMESEVPMDRLLCGDVGFGKTEVAMRAIFKAVSSSRQVGVLVPTTILAQQHYETFLERFEGFPVSVGVLSRFRTASQVKRTLSELESGALDVVIGTHRILSQDVVFNRLGLLIIDEEHRFGVKHKERIKEIKTSVDSLSMTATPIPRTLQMSLMGARDISMLKVPPKERQPVETHIIPFDEKLIRAAVLREVDRGGQVFFIHNRVESIQPMYNKLQTLLPEVRFAVGHGQMKSRDLERIMLGFFHREFDVLLSTTIVESGLDIPNANTIIINRADAMGLSQLYQLRGRVGRSNRKAWAYFLSPEFSRLNANAIKRLNALERHAHYGGGYELAMRDLEIRGSGNVFGTEQSGHIATIGYHLYTKMLRETLETLKQIDEGAPEPFPPVEISFDGEAGIPAGFVEDTVERIAVYRRVAGADTLEEILEIRRELRERFGVLPAETEALINLSRVRLLANQLGVERLTVKSNRAQGNFVIKHVEQAGSEIIKSLSKAVADTDIDVEIMNNRSLTFLVTEKPKGDILAALRKFLERLREAATFFA